MSEVPVTKKKYSELLTEKEYIKNLVASIINRFGDSIDAIAFTWLVYSVTGSASLTAVTYGVNYLMSVLLQPFTSAMITNLNKKMILVAADIGRGLVVAVTAFLFMSSQLQPWMIICGTALMSTLEAFRVPAGTSILPDILTREKYSLGSSLSGGLSRIVEIIGMSLAGGIIALIGIHGALFIDVATFVVSAAILATLKLPKHEKAPTGNFFGNFKKDMLNGIKYMSVNKLAISLCVAGMLINFAFVPLSALQSAYISESIKLSVVALSAMGIASAAGMAIGALIFPKIDSKKNRFWFFFIGLIIACSSYLGLSAITFLSTDFLKYISLGLTMFIFGFSIGIVNTSVSVSFVENIDREYLARVGGIMHSGMTLTIPVGSFMVAFVVAYIPVTYLMFGFGLLSIAATMMLLFLKPLRKL